jgi:hypothetical protein
MTTPTGPLNEVYQVTLNSSGNGTITISPGAAASPGSGVGASRRGGFSWDVQSVIPSVYPLAASPGVVKTLTVSVYVSYGIQQAGQAQLVGNAILPSTTAGPSSLPCQYPGTLIPGDWVTVTFTGGDVGAIATVRVFGTANYPAPR